MTRHHVNPNSAAGARANALAFFGVVVTLAVVAFVIVRVEAFSTKLEETAIENRALACATADLVAHVPAVQFEGESLRNFIGWIEARADILVAAKEANTCEPRIVRSLERRIEKDNALLDQLRQ